MFKGLYFYFKNYEGPFSYIKMNIYDHAKMYDQRSRQIKTLKVKLQNRKRSKSYMNLLQRIWSIAVKTFYRDTKTTSVY